MEDTASLFEAILTWGFFVLVFGGAIAAQLWAKRRRKRRVEAATSNAEGAEVLFNAPVGPGGTG